MKYTPSSVPKNPEILNTLKDRTEIEFCSDCEEYISFSCGLGLSPVVVDRKLMCENKVETIR